MKHMFSSLVLAAAAFVTAPSTALSHAYHTPNICSESAADVCAHLGFKEEPSSAEAAEFMLHFMPAANIDPAEIKDVTVALWMDMGGHGHGSSPVSIAQGNAAHYAVSEAYFVMPGDWQVKIGFTYQNAAHEIVIPVAVK